MINFNFIIFVLSTIFQIILYITSAACLLFGFVLFKWLYDGYKSMKRVNPQLKILHYLSIDLFAILIPIILFIFGICGFILFKILWRLM